jgi:hypothetical protein
MSNLFISGAIKQFKYYKLLGEKAMAQLNNEQLLWKQNEESNSIANIIQHLSGNMLSRWTDFFTTDGEKPTRNREAEFENILTDRTAILNAWEQGWVCLFAALDSITENDLQKIIYIRNEGQTVLDAVIRQLSHYPYHVGQIIYIAKILVDKNWESLSIPKGKSSEYNDARFGKPKEIKHFTEDTINKK